jgi:colanic acid biosynthesis glycosyl transferase WcaI
MPMRILYISQYFPPEAGATQSRAYEMAKNWVKLGHRVTMITEFPNHPSGIIAPGYKGKLFAKSELDGIEVLRVWVKASPAKNFVNRMLFYFSFMVNASIAGVLLARGKFDFIYASSPPLFVGGTALFLRVIKRTPMVFEVRDLWPEVAVAMGELTQPAGIYLSTKLEELCYRKAIQVVPVTYGFYNRLKDRGVSEDKLIVITNGSNTDLYRFNINGRKLIREELGLYNKFIVIYAGILGLQYDFDNLIKTADILKISEDIHFVIIGDGPKKTEIQNLLENAKLPNVTLLPEKPLEDIPDYLSASDVALIPFRKLDIFKATIPLKLFDAWACSRPVILCNEGESIELVNSAKGGITIPPEDPEKMAEAILRLKQSPSERKSMGDNGLRYINLKYSRAMLAERLVTHLENLIKS